MFLLLVSILVVIRFWFITDIRTRDSSHGISHFWAVRNNVTRIIANMTADEHDAMMLLQQYQIRPILVLHMAALCHDVNDHKYGQVYNWQDNLLRYFMTRKEVNVVDMIVRNVSFSREHIGETDDLHNMNLLLHIVQSADRMEAIGHVGMERCIEYTRSLMVDYVDIDVVNANVYKHCQEKLLLIRPYYIHCASAARLIDGDHSHDVIVQFCKDYEDMFL